MNIFHSVKGFIKEMLLFLMGISFVLIGIFTTIGLVASDSYLTNTIGYIVLVCIVALLISGGLYMCYLSVRARKKRRKIRLETMILQTASKKGGSVTALEVAMETSLSIEEAKKVLEQLVEQKIAFLKLSSNGTYVYQFDGLISQTDKEEAESLKNLIYKE